MYFGLKKRFLGTSGIDNLVLAQLHKLRKVTGDAPCVRELKAAGALLVGKANVHEIGVGMTGLNTIHGTTRNPYDVQCYTGGSSSGSAAIAASGLCPFALGAPKEEGGFSFSWDMCCVGVVTGDLQMLRLKGWRVMIYLSAL